MRRGKELVKVVDSRVQRQNSKKGGGWAEGETVGGCGSQGEKGGEIAEEG